MAFFESKQILYYLLCFAIIPLVSCLVLYYRKSNRMWLSPLVSVFLFFAVSFLFYPYYFQDIVHNDYEPTTIIWLIVILPIQILVSCIYTGIVYVMRKKKSKDCSQQDL